MILLKLFIQNHACLSPLTPTMQYHLTQKQHQFRPNTLTKHTHMTSWDTLTVNSQLEKNCGVTTGQCQVFEHAPPEEWRRESGDGGWQMYSKVLLYKDHSCDAEAANISPSSSLVSVSTVTLKGNIATESTKAKHLDKTEKWILLCWCTQKTNTLKVLVFTSASWIESKWCVMGVQWPFVT